MSKNTIGDWLYFATEEVNVRDIFQLVESEYETEIWEDAGVLEITLKDGNSIDIEAAKIHPKDEITAAFAEEKGAKNVFLITFIPDSFDEAKNVMQLIYDKLGGVFCGDTEDFKPEFPEA